MATTQITSSSISQSHSTQLCKAIVNFLAKLLASHNYPKTIFTALTMEFSLIISGFLFVCSLAVANESTYQQDPQYGNSQHSAFANAIYGTTPPLSEEEASQARSRKWPSNDNKFFVRLGANRGTSTVSAVKNQSTTPDLKEAKIASATQKTTSRNSAELGLGYKFDRLWLELELMFTENIKYNKDPLFSNTSGSIASTVKAQSVLLNAYYDFAKFSKLRLFIGVGIGNGINKTNSLFAGNPVSTNESFAKRKIAGAYNLALGGKLNLAPQFFISGYLRYTSFSGIRSGNIFPKRRMQWRDELLNLNLTGEHNLTAVGISISHMFL